MAAWDVVFESVPRFVRRLGDQVQEGSNNVIVILGTDRPDKIDSGHGSEVGSGTYHVIAGRAGEDPSFDKDESFLYLTRKTDVDKNLGTDQIERIAASGPSLIGKSDHVRIVARKDAKIVIGTSEYVVMKDDLCVVEFPEIRLGRDADQKVIRGSKFRSEHQSMHQKLKSALESLRTDIISAASQLNTAGGDPVLSGLASTAATAIVSAGGALQAAAQAIGQCASAIDTFENSDPEYLSKVSKTL